jgi:signal transduction histidine kinase
MIPLLNRGGLMKGFVQGADRQQTTLLPECLDDWVGESNPIRAVDVFVDVLELRDLGFDGVDPAATGRPAYHPSPMLKLYIYGYLNRVQSSRRLEREAGLHAFPDGKGGAIRIKVQASGSDKVEILFSDNGCGMSADVGRQAFNPFFTTRRETVSTGLGLHIVHNIVTNRLGGQLNVDSAPGEGTKIRVVLPLSAPARRAARGSHDAETP